MNETSNYGAELKKKLKDSLYRRKQLDEVRVTDLLQRLEVIELCRGNSYAPYWTSVEHPAGSRMEVMLNEEVCGQIFLYGAYEEILSDYIVSQVKPGDTFIDAGAHYGYFSILASSLVGSEGKVISFEAHPQNYEVLCRNLDHRPNALAYNLALWEHEQRLAFNAAEVAFSAFSSVAELRRNPSEPKPSISKIEVQATSLDKFCLEHKLHPNFIKIDVESSEMQVLRGSRQILSASRPKVSIEVGDFEWLIAKGVPTSREVLQEMIGMDYSLFDLTLDGLTPHRFKKVYEYNNVIALPKD